MAEVRAFPALRYAADPALTIAPPYDVISPGEQRALYDRSPHNVVRVEYGEQREGDTAHDNRYTRAAGDLRGWRASGVLALDAAPAIYGYRQEFEWDGVRHARQAWFVALRLEEWSKAVVKPHEHTLAKPKADRLDLLRATRTQVSPVYSLFRPRDGRAPVVDGGARIIDCTADGQRHVVTSITEAGAIAAFAAQLAASDVYIADGHHRYETALAYRDEVRAKASSWSGEEPENFVLMALTHHADPGLLVLPTHRIVHRAPPPDVRDRLERYFRIEELAAGTEARRSADSGRTAFVAHGLADTPLLLTLEDRAGVEALMPRGESAAWMQLDVNVLQYGVLEAVFGIDAGALTAGGAVTYTQDAAQAAAAVASGDASAALLLNATPVEQVLAVSDANGRMPQKSTYFYPKLPTGLVMRALD